MNPKIKISQLPAKGSNLAAEDLLEVAEFTGTGYVSKSITGQEIIDAIPAASVDWGDIGGTLSDQTDLNTALNSKVPTSRTLTINGTTQDLSANRTFTISTGITIGTTSITSGAVGRVLFEGSGNVVQESANLFWDNTNGRLGIGTTTPNQTLVVNGDARVNNLNTASGYTGNVGSAAAPFANINAVNFSSPGNATLLASASTFIGSGGTFAIGVFQSTRNVLIQNGGTYTDAGYRLDVNGTARVNSTASTGLTITQGASGDAIVIQNGGFIQMASTRLRASSSNFQFQDISYNIKVNLSMSGFSYFNSGANYTFGSITEVTSAIVNIDSTTKGFLPPRMTTTQKNAIATPATGLQVYDTTLNRPCFYNGSSWITL